MREATPFRFVSLLRDWSKAKTGRDKGPASFKFHYRVFGLKTDRNLSRAIAVKFRRKRIADLIRTNFTSLLR